VWPDGVVVHAPEFSQHAQFLDREEDLAIQELVPELRVERFAVTVLPWRSELDVERVVSVAASRCLALHFRDRSGNRILSSGVHEECSCCATQRARFEQMMQGAKLRTHGMQRRVFQKAAGRYVSLGTTDK
jgi:hypothetical protein